MNNKINEALVILSEECSELIQESCKALRFGLASEWNDETVREKLLAESGDVLALIGILAELGVFTDEEINERVMAKRKKLEKWSNLFDETEI